VDVPMQEEGTCAHSMLMSACQKVGATARREICRFREASRAACHNMQALLSNVLQMSL